MNVCGHCHGVLTRPDVIPSTRWGCLRCGWSLDVELGSYCTVASGVRVGAGTVIKNYVELRSGTVIGENCFVDSYVVTSGDCEIGDRVTLRYGTIVAKGCQLGHDVYCAPRVMFNNLNHKREAIGGAWVGDDAFIGTHAVIAAGISIREGAIIGAQAFVSKSITEPGTYVGIPANKLVRVASGGL